MYAFAARRRWVVLHAVVALIVGLFALAGVWQLHRLDERRAHNALITSRRAKPIVDISSVVKDPDAAVQRRVRAKGRYDLAREVILLGRPDMERPGNHLLTPLVIPGGRAVIVDRGWVPEGSDRSPVRDALPPDGEVEVTGIMLPSEGHGPFGGPGNDSEHLEQIARIDVARLARSLPYKTLSTYVLLQRQDPPQRELPDRVEPERIEQGPHLFYAIQWFSFIAISIIGYGALLRREARRTPTPQGVETP